MLKKILQLTLLNLLFSSALFGNSSGEVREVKYSLPLKLPISLSGSYGELRSTHFHAGVDFRIGGTSGAPLYAAADGYISRVTVSPVGFGHAIFIDHPDGNTTIYGHMMDFAPEIAEWVREQQYQRESFSINLVPPKEMFPIGRGEFIGRAGNTGSSGGPHLHFEIRDSESQLALNPLKIANFSVEDNIPPQFQQVDFYSIKSSDNVAQRELLASFQHIHSGVVAVTDTFYIAVAAIDRQNNTGAKLGVYHYNYYLNDSLIFSFTPENIAPGMGGYINSVVEYSRKATSNLSMIKSWVEPGCAIQSNIHATNNGLFIVDNDNINIVKVELIDEHDNRSVREFRVQRSEGTTHPPQEIEEGYVEKGYIMPWFIPNRYSSSTVRALLPAGALYSSIDFVADTLSIDGRLYHAIHNESTPVHNSFLLSIRCFNDVDSSLYDKLVLAKRGRNGRHSCVGGTYKRGWVEAKVSSFGNYTIMIDTVAPTITPRFTNNQNLSGRSSLSFSVRDSLSGLASYRVMIDGEWVLSAYDPKFNRIETELRSDVIKRGRKHEIVIFVTDNRGNSSTLKREFIW